MWFRKSSPRRQAIRSDVVEAESSSRTRLQQTGPIAAIALVFFVLATLVFYFPSEPLPYRVGDRPLTDLRAPVAFSVADPTETERLRQYEREHTPPVLAPNGPVLSNIEFQLTKLYYDVKDSPNIAAVSPEVTKRFPLAPASLQMLRAMRPEDWAKFVRAVMSTLQGTPIVDQSVFALLSTRNIDSVVLLKPKAEAPGAGGAGGAAPRLEDMLSVPLLRTGLIHAATHDHNEQQVLREQLRQSIPPPLVDPVAAFVINLGQPTFVVDPGLSARLADARAASLRVTGVSFAPNEVIVKANEPISPAQYEYLRTAQDAYEHHLAARQPWAHLLARLGEALVVLVLTVAGVVYVVRMNPVANTVGRGWALCGLLLLTLFIAKNTVALMPYTLYMLGLGPTLLAAVILVIAFNQRFALGMAAIHGLLVTLALNQGVDFYLALLSGVATFTFLLGEIRTRSKLVEVGALASGVLFASVWALGLARFMGSVWNTNWLLTTDVASISRHAMWAAGAGIAVGGVALMIIPFIERMFKITTSMTLLELCDANRPLLRRLAQEATGTFNHSLTVGIMAEAAANAIGANGLLCRAGAYYHDIGKLSKPSYFIENQGRGPNRHDKLSPAMSLLIIVGHVKDGIELAREYGLPWVVHQFIAQHHGTTLVEYFYHAARKRAEEADDTTVTEAEFRYPGPKPQSRETAIIMVCDGVESIVRSLGEPSPGRIESVVHNLIMKRLMDGQFSECDLTLRDLSDIEQSLIRSLAGIYHGRVAYPKPLAISKPA